MPGTPVGMVGNRGDSLDDAVTHVIDHYLPALHAAEEVGEA